MLFEAGLRISDRYHLFPRFFRILNCFDITYYDKTGYGMYYAHPYISYDIKPGYMLPEELVSINSLGFRGEEFSLQKPPGTYRIVCLGGSTTYGIFMGNNQTYPSYLEEIVRKRCCSDKIEVINGGMTSATSAETLAIFLYKVAPLEPDMVVFYEGYNDLVPRIFNQFSDDYYHFRKSPHNVRTWYSRLYIYRMFQWFFCCNKYFPNYSLLAATWKYGNLPKSDIRKMQNFNKTTSSVYKRNLDYIIAVAKNRHIAVVLSTFAFNDELQNWNYLMPDPLWARGIEENNRVIRELAAKYQLPLIEYNEFGLKHKDVFYDSIHMTADGNRQMADFFSRRLAPIITEKMKGDSGTIPLPEKGR
jgi:lysophospholipase L1-like esterase